ncbi:MAG: STAS domain-containing protein [Planctomycetes bacterium]|nr:STAS domain-containing protein [Planctomycetota bacterium]
MTTPASLLLGRIALRHRFITHGQLEECLRVQEERERAGGRTAIGAILRERGYIDDRQLRALLVAQRVSKVKHEDLLFGRIAVRNHFVTPNQVRECLQEQQERLTSTRRLVRIGEIMVRREILSPQQFKAIARAQQRIRESRVGQESLAELLKHGVPEDEARVREEDLAPAAASRPAAEGPSADVVEEDYRRLVGALEAKKSGRPVDYDAMLRNAMEEPDEDSAMPPPDVSSSSFILVEEIQREVARRSQFVPGLDDEVEDEGEGSVDPTTASGCFRKPSRDAMPVPPTATAFFREKPGRHAPGERNRGKDPGTTHDLPAVPAAPAARSPAASVAFELRARSLSEEVREGRSVQVVTARGKVDTSALGALKEALDRAGDRTRPRVVLHLGAVSYFSSSALRCLREYSTRFRAAGGDLRLAAVPPPILSVLEVTGDAELVQSFEDEDKAVLSFKYL